MTDRAPSRAPWRLGVRILFRFFGLFFLLSNLSWIFGFIGLDTFYNELLQKPILWTARNVLGIGHEIPLRYSGSGDRTYDYTLFFIIMVLSVTGTVIWSVADRKRTHYTRLHEWLRVFLRYVLGMTMLGYGFAKVFWIQMQAPSLTQLLTPYGESTPMALAWTFMGFSQGYAMFAGGLEVIGGLLLFWRRTTTLGALVLLGVIINIFAVNLCFDVPVKLYSFQLILLTLFLLAPDVRRLWDVVVMRKAVRAQVLVPHFRNKTINTVLFWLKHAAILFFVYTQISGSLTQSKQYGPGYERSALYGIWEVKEFVRNRDTIPPLLTDNVRWRRMVADRKGWISVYGMQEKRQLFRAEIDTTTQILIAGTIAEDAPADTLHYEYSTPRHLQLEGKFQGDTLTMSLELYDRSNFKLVSRGFHWINEYPYNR